MKKITMILTAIAAASLLTLGTAVAAPDNGNGNQGCDDGSGNPTAYKNPGEMIRALKDLTGMAPGQLIKLTPNHDTVGDWIKSQCKS